MRLLFVGHGFRPFHEGGLILYAEDIMRAHVERGHQVSYFCSGRDYGVGGLRVRRFEREGVDVREVINSPIVFGGNSGTRRPELELEHEPTERAFREVLHELRPDVVHFHEITGLPSTLLSIAGETGASTVMDLHDYFTLCPTAKLFDVDDQNCRRFEPEQQCVRCNLGAGMRARRVLDTLSTHRRVIERDHPALGRLPRPGAVALQVRLALRDRREAAEAQGPPAPPPAPDPATVDTFARRRRLNVERLNGLTRLVAASPQLADLYRLLGVDGDRIRDTRFVLKGFEGLEAQTIEAVEPPLRFITLAGCSSVSKGARVVTEAVQQLEAEGFTEQDLTVTVAGAIDRSFEQPLAASRLVRTVGKYQPADLKALLADHHVGIVPSIWEEALGFVGIELLARGLPVIGNAAGGIVEYVRDGETGWVNRSRSGSGLARIMASIAESPEQVAALNAKVVAAHDEFARSFADHVEEVESMYRELVTAA